MLAWTRSHRVHDRLLHRSDTLGRHQSLTEGTTSMHRTTRRWVTGAAVLTAGVFTVGPVTASAAQSDDTGGSTSTTAPPAASPAPAKPAAPKATAPKDAGAWIKNVLDNLVKAGTITQAQADAVTKALQDAKPMLEHGPGGRGGPGGRFGAGLALDAAAKVLGVTVDELRTELQSGKTVAEIAKAHGIDVQKVIDGLAADAKTKLDEAVKAGRITQEQADTRLKEMTDRLTKLVNEKLPVPPTGDGHRGGPGRRGGSDQGATTDHPRADHDDRLTLPIRSRSPAGSERENATEGQGVRSEPELRAHPRRHGGDRVVGLGRPAGEEVEDVLHLRVHLDRAVDAGRLGLLGEAGAVVEQRLVAADLDQHRRQPRRVGVQRVGQRILR